MQEVALTTNPSADDVIQPNYVADVDDQNIQAVIADYQTGQQGEIPNKFTDSTADELTDEQRYLNWKDNLDLSEPFMTEEQVDNVQLRKRMETALKRMLPRSKNTPEQATAYAFLSDGEFFKVPENNNYATVLRLLNNEPSYLWTFYKTLAEVTQGENVDA